MGHKKLVAGDQSKSYPSFLRKKLESIEYSTLNDLVLFDMADDESVIKFTKLVECEVITKIIDNYAEQYAELLLSKNAHLYRANDAVKINSIAKLLDEHYGDNQPWRIGTWVYFPWSGELVHVLAQADFETLRTIRNRDLISAEEQKLLFEFNAVCFGMSVGSAGALALAITGISRNIKLVDGAVISGSNLNRILTGVNSVGLEKASVISRLIYEMNPYSVVEKYNKVDSHNIDRIFDDLWSSHVVIDEIDDIEMKVRIRFEARKRKIPVIMATELGDTIMLDVERFDLEPKRELFHGMVPEIENLLNRKIDNHREWTKHAVSIIDPSNMPLKMQKSLLKIGTNIVTHPQLGSTVMMTGGVIAFAVKNIALGNPLKSGRYIISLEKELLADHKTRKYSKTHKKHTKVIKKSVNSMQ